MDSQYIKISTIAKIVLLRDIEAIAEEGDMVLVNSSYQPGKDSFLVKSYAAEENLYDIAVVLDRTIEPFFFSMIMNGFIFRSTVKGNSVHDKPKRITLRSIRDYHIPRVGFAQQSKLGNVENLIEFLTSKQEYYPPINLIDYLKDLRDSICLELYMSGFFSKLGVSVIEEVNCVTDVKLDFSKNDVILTLINNLAGPESTVRMKVREMNVVMSHFFKNLDEILKKNDLEN